jgi:hypothetical protein
LVLSHLGLSHFDFSHLGLSHWDLVTRE